MKNRPVRTFRVACVALGSILVAVFVAASAWWLLGGLAHRRVVVLIGIDGATWDVALPLVRAGRMPNLARLLPSSYGSWMSTLSPSLSPVIWTTIATGRPAEEHGIRGFTDRDPASGEAIPYTSNQRAYRAFWNVLSENDRSVGVVGWWITFPAESVRGAMVSSYSALRGRTWKGSVYKDLPGQMHPPQLASRYRPLIHDAEAEIGSLFDDEFLEGIDTERLRPAQREAIEDTRDVVLSDVVYARIARDLLASSRYDAFAVYFASVDVASHRFWKYRDDGYRGKDGSLVPGSERDELGPVIDRTYAFTDRLIGDVLGAAPSGSTVIVISDHGFHAECVPGLDDDSRSGGHEAADLPGILLLNGPGILPREVESTPVTEGLPSVFDIFPTLLHFAGLPVPRDVRGRVLEEVLAAPERLLYPVRRCDTFETRYRHRELGPIRTDVDETLRERWRGIGYIGGAPERREDSPGTDERQ